MDVRCHSIYRLVAQFYHVIPSREGLVVFDPFLSGSYPIIEDSTKSCLAINMDDSHIRTTLELDKFNLVLDVSGKLRLPTSSGTGESVTM